MQFRLPAGEVCRYGSLVPKHRVDLRSVCDGFRGLRIVGIGYSIISLFREGKRARMSFFLV